MYCPAHFEKGDTVWTWFEDDKGYHIVSGKVVHLCVNPKDGATWITYDYEYAEKFDTRLASMLFYTKQGAVDSLRSYLIHLSEGARHNISNCVNTLQRYEHDLQRYLEGLSMLDDLPQTQPDDYKSKKG